LQSPSRPVAELTSRPVWSVIKAVTSGRVYVNPSGVFPWDRYGPEAALQLVWAGKMLHPDLFPDMDLRAETRAFYQMYLGYSASDEDLSAILMTPP
jgi:iron complex transport system substrate-binding protein